MPERLPPSLQQAYEAAVDRALQAAVGVARGVHGPGRPLTAREPPAVVAKVKQAERVALRTWAEQCGLIALDAAFTAKWAAQGGISGQENDVFLEHGRVQKRNNLSFHLTYVDFFDRLALHNLLFPGAPVRFEGFTGASQLWPVFSQPFIPAVRGARRAEVEAFMLRAGYSRIRGDVADHRPAAKTGPSSSKHPSRKSLSPA